MRKFFLLGLMSLIGGMIWIIPEIAHLEENENPEILIVCNKNVPAESLTRDQIRKIFLGRVTEWDDNRKIKFVTLKTERDHSLFLKTYIGKSESQYRNYFNMMVFTGKGRAPKSFSTVKALLEYVENTEGAIGYISVADKNLDTGNVKILNSDK